MTRQLGDGVGEVRERPYLALGMTCDLQLNWTCELDGDDVTPS
jgi:hypothetical protein